MMKGLNWKAIGEGIGICAMCWILFNFAVIVLLAITGMYNASMPTIKAPTIDKRIDQSFTFVIFLSAALGGYRATQREAVLKNALIAGGISLIFVFLFLSAAAHKFSFPQNLWLLFFGFIFGGLLHLLFNRNRVLDSQLTSLIPLP